MPLRIVGEANDTHPRGSFNAQDGCTWNWGLEVVEHDLTFQQHRLDSHASRNDDVDRSGFRLETEIDFSRVPTRGCEIEIHGTGRRHDARIRAELEPCSEI